MKLKNLFTDDDAVSPVIGVILMVAITVILAAVIGAFVLNIGGNQESAPQAQFSGSYTPGGAEGDFEDGSGATWDTGDTWSIQHSGGGNVDVTQLSLTWTSTATSPTTEITDLTDDNQDGIANGEAWGDTISAGDEIQFEEVAGSNIYFTSGEEWSLVWTSESQDSSQIISESTFP